MELISYLKKRQMAGDTIILWACREGEALKDVVSWCAKHRLIFDAVNENALETQMSIYDDSRKVFAHEYIDDKNSTRFNLPFVAEEK